MIQLRGVTKKYKNQYALKNINLDIPKGKTFALVGPSGGGKTTICHLIPHFYDITSGELLIDGKEIHTMTMESFRKNTEFYSALENSLNVSYDNIMVRAREELKQERKVDFDLVNLFFAGFPAKSICFLKDMTEASVRMRKSRLKLFFAALPDHRGDDFVKILERKD